MPSTCRPSNPRFPKMPILLTLTVILFILFACGIRSAANTFDRGSAAIRAHMGSRKEKCAQTATAEADANVIATGPQTTRTCLEDLKNVFALYQSGVLTKEEFEQVKGHFLAQMKSCA